MAVRPPDDVLSAVEEALIPARRSMVGPRWASPEQWHLTLQFLGPVASVASVVQALGAVSSLRAFSARLGGAGAFPSVRRAKVIWIGAAVGGVDLVSLAAAVAPALAPLGYEADPGRFRPHLTVARLRTPADVTPALAALGDSLVGRVWTIGEVVLYESRLSPRGSSYSVLARVPLSRNP